VDPKEEFSVAQYTGLVHKIIRDVHRRGKLPILVGGTGLYIKGAVEGIPTATIPKSISLRKKYKYKSVVELQSVLEKLDSYKFTSMNTSDRNNPRRLRQLRLHSLSLRIRVKMKIFIGLSILD
jgi:tRNA dimethylallyltransferase